MKKTIIALLALAGVAFGLDKGEINSALGTALTEQGYKHGYDFTITLSGITQLGSTGGDKFLFLTDNTTDNIPDNIYLFNQASGFLSINKGTDSSNWLASSDYVVDLENKTASITLAYTDLTANDTKANYGYWFVGGFVTNAETGKTEFQANGNAGTSNITDFTLSYSKENIVSISVTRADSSVHTLNITGLELDATQVSFFHPNTRANSLTVKVIPEPATATLSLLALAGLAARRRRK